MRFSLGIVATIFHTTEFCDAPEFIDMLLHMTGEKECQGFLHADFMINQVGPGVESQHPELVAAIKNINVANITSRAIADAVIVRMAETFGAEIELAPLTDYDNSHEANMKFVMEKAQQQIARMAARQA